MQSTGTIVLAGNIGVNKLKTLAVLDRTSKQIDTPTFSKLEENS